MMRIRQHETPEMLEQKKTYSKTPMGPTTALPRHQAEEETDKTKQAQIEQTYVKHSDWLSFP